MTTLRWLAADHLLQRRLPPDQTAARCPADIFAFQTTAEVKPLTGHMIGQPRATRAIEFGLQVKEGGYNLYLSGPAGTGKTTFATAQARRAAAQEDRPRDWCYVHNFQQPDQPCALSLPPGRGRLFQREMAELLEDIRAAITRTFESDDYDRRRREVVTEFERRIEAVWKEVEQEARQEGFALQRTPTGIVTIPLTREGRPMAQEEYMRLPQQVQQEMQGRMRAVQTRMSAAMRRVQTTEKEARQALKELEQESGLYAVGHLIGQLKEQYEGEQGVQAYLDEVQQDVLSHLQVFLGDGADEDGQRRPGRGLPELSLSRYAVNLLVDHSETKGAPVVVEANPTYNNLVGRVEYKAAFGTMVTEHTMIKCGALHQANGGYLILQVSDLLQSPLSWQALVRCLKTGQVRIEHPGEYQGLLPTASLKPAPIPLKVKVILIGSPMLYSLLHAHDEDFRKLFKVQADFDSSMPRNEENLAQYAGFVCSFCTNEDVPHLEPAAMARMVDYSSRLAGHQKKLSTRFHEIVEVVREAGAWARLEGRSRVSAADVERALEERAYRANLLEEKIQEMIADGTILVDVDGEAPGQVNGLAVLGLGHYTFGKPGRITARTFVGDDGVINIEREVDMSGRIHAKGVLVLSGFLGGRFGGRRPLPLSASIGFEQLYEEVDGDSAASAELYALLTSLAGVGIRQGIAVTGSVNQNGEIQPIGGVNEKIEGFYAVCKLKGLTGKQGVMIPVQNVPNLMLRPEVHKAVAAGKFHIWAVSTIDEGLEILTGIEAGERRSDGSFAPGTVNGLVEARLQEMAESLKDFQRPADRA